MKTSNPVLKYFPLLFILTEAVFFVLVQTVEGRANAYVSFTSILIAVLFTVSAVSKSSEYLLTQAAMLTTLCADVFLVLFSPPVQLPAMIFFSVTQICYFIRILLRTENKRTRALHVGTRIAALLIAIPVTFLVLGDKTDALSVISIIYFVNLAFNVVFSFLLKNRSLALSIGLLCFLLCDFFVGMGCIGVYIPISEGSFAYYLANPPFNVAWLFYVPAQTLIPLSLFEMPVRTPKKAKENALT